MDEKNIHIRQEYSIDYFVQNLRCGGDGLGGGGDASVKKNVESRLAIEFARVAKISHFRYGYGGILGYTGKCYLPFTPAEFDYIICESLTRMNVGDVYRTNSFHHIHRYVLNTIMGKPYNPNKNLVGFRNGVLNLDTLELYEHNEKYETNYYLDVDYDHNAKAKRFHQFLAEVLPNGDTIRVLQEYIGALFVDRKEIEITKILYLLGEGANGKSVFTSTLQALFGKDNYTPFSMESLLKSSDKGYNIAKMNGKLVNICSDMSHTDISGGDFKRLVAGEDMSGRPIYGEPINCSEIPLQIVSVNRMPVTTDHSHGHHRRTLIIPFNVTIPHEKQDHQLTFKLRQELSGIALWIIEGRTRFIKQGGTFSSSKEVLDAAENVVVASNSILQWLREEEIYPSGDSCFKCNFETYKVLYDKYKTYCKDNNVGIFKLDNWRDTLKGKGFQPHRTTAGRGFCFWIRVLDEPLPADEKQDSTLWEEENPEDLPF